jgi:hypothetical protein
MMKWLFLLYLKHILAAIFFNTCYGSSVSSIVGPATQTVFISNFGGGFVAAFDPYHVSDHFNPIF